MRLCTYRDGGGSRLGAVEGDLIRPLEGRDVRDALEAIPSTAPGPAGAAGRGGAARSAVAGHPARDRAQLPRPRGRDRRRAAGTAAAVRQAGLLGHGAGRRGGAAGLHGRARLRGRAGGRDRPGRPRRAGRAGPRPRVRVRGDERPLRARPPARGAPVDPRQGRRRLRPVRPLDHDGRRGARPPGAVHPHLGQRRAAPGRHDPRHGLLGGRADRVLLVELHPAPGRRDHHRHPGRGRRRPGAEGVPPARRPRAGRDRRSSARWSTRSDDAGGGARCASSP